MKTEQVLIAEAYANLNEAKEAPFKEGDRVMTVTHSSWYSQYRYPGKVVKTNKFGHMHVEYDHQPGVHHIFGADRYLRDGFKRNKLVPEHEGIAHNKKQDERRERNHDLNSVSELIAGHKNGFGDHSKLDKETADKIHELIKKHTEAPKE